MSSTTQYKKASNHLHLLANWFVFKTMFKATPEVKFAYVDTVLKRQPNQFTRILDHQLDLLQERDKTSLIQALIEIGFSTIAIAKLLGCSQPTVSYHKNRPLKPAEFEQYVNEEIKRFDEQRIH